MRSSIEVLESRIAPAGVVGVTYTAATGTLVIDAGADNMDHAIHVFPTGANTFRIESTDGTSIGTDAYQDLTGKLTAVSYIGGDGSDDFHINNFKSLATLSFDGKDGVDRLDADDLTTTGAVTVKFGADTSGSGDQSGAFFSGQAITIGGNVVADYGSGGGYLDFNAIVSTIKGGVTLTGGLGADQFYLEGSTASIAKGINFIGNAGDDYLSFDAGALVTVGKAADGRALMFDGGPDKDELSIYGAGLVNLMGKVQFDGGAGDNTITVQADALTIGGDFIATGGDDADDLDIAPYAMKVTGAVNLSLGNGANTLDLFALSMTVSKTFTYVGGIGTDDFGLDGTSLTISGGLSVTLGDGINSVDISPRVMKFTAPSALLPALEIHGGADGDDIEVSPHVLTVTGTTILDAGNGTNILELRPENGTYTKDVTMTGGTGDDSLTFGRDTAALKASLIVTLGDGTNDLEIQPDVMTVTKDLKITGLGGDDTVYPDATFLKVMGVTDINLGDGANTVDGYMASASFSKSVTYHGGTGSDDFSLGGTTLAVKGAVDLEFGEGINFLDLHPSTITFSDSLTVKGEDTVLGGVAANQIFLGSRIFSVAKATTISLGSGANLVNFDAPQSSFGALSVTSLSGADAVNFFGTKFSASGLVKFDLGAGDDVVNLTARLLTLKAGLTILGGNDGDYANLNADGTITGDVNIDLGGASDNDQSISITGNSGLPGNLKITGALTLISGATETGNMKADFITVTDVAVTKAISVTGGAVNSAIYIDNASTGSTFTLDSGDGDDDVQIENGGFFGSMTIAKATSIALGDGKDALIIGFDSTLGSNDYVRFLAPVSVDGGAGADTMNNFTDPTVNFYAPGVPTPVPTGFP